jgi:hypothetical protein
MARDDVGVEVEASIRSIDHSSGCVNLRFNVSSWVCIV